MFLACLRGIETLVPPRYDQESGRVFSLPKRNWNNNTFSASSTVGQFLACLRGIETNYSRHCKYMGNCVFSLPKRNWNKDQSLASPIQEVVFSLPKRNWNVPALSSTPQASSVFSLPKRNWNKNLGILLSVKWKPFLACLRGIETYDVTLFNWFDRDSF